MIMFFIKFEKIYAQMEEYYRQLLFRHLDGIVCIPILGCLQENGIIDYIKLNENFTLHEVAQFKKSNVGYLHVALRCLASQGILKYQSGENPDAIVFKHSEKTLPFLSLVTLIQPVYARFKKSDFFTSVHWNSSHKEEVQFLFSEYRNIQNQLKKEISSYAEDLRLMLEGFFVGPIIVGLGMTGMFHNYFMESSFTAEEFHKEPQLFETILEFLSQLGWFSEKNKHYQFTDLGLSFAKKATAYGVTVSYLPMFQSLDKLLFGNATEVKEYTLLETEKHVNREMNVWGSGGAHSTYFKAIDSVILSIFNQPLDQQPKGILDMGCGNGAFLIHLYTVIERFTLRGKHLQDYPLFLVGVDYNTAALKVTRSNLISADIWAKVIWGDISDPSQLAQDLLENYAIELGDLLNVRTFLDHNRIWEEVVTTSEVKYGLSSGAYASKGQFLSSEIVQENLKQHFLKWKPYIEKNGLLLIELHTVNPNLVANHLGKTAATAYDATHGFSDQYIVEIDNFIDVLNRIGLYSQSEYFKKYPNTDLATVSLHVIKSK